MILTPITDDRLESTLEVFAESLSDHAAHLAFRRIVGAADARRAAGQIALKNYADAIDIIAKFEIGTKPGTPQLAVSWDGGAVCTETEAYVLLHEVAHYQLAAPARRGRIDFGLGPGPETGDRDRAARAQTLFGLAHEREEAMASLLGILWETELGHPALASLLDQNWLEGVPAVPVPPHTSPTLWARSPPAALSTTRRGR